MGQATTADRVLAAEAVEIYRPLLVDPKEVRKARAAKAKAARAQGDQDASGAWTLTPQIEAIPVRASGPHAHQLIFLKPEGQLRLRNSSLPLRRDKVVPAVFMEGVLDQRRAHDVAHLPTIEPRTKLLQHLFGYHIALFDIDAVDAGNPKLLPQPPRPANKQPNARGRMRGITATFSSRSIRGWHDNVKSRVPRTFQSWPHKIES